MLLPWDLEPLREHIDDVTLTTGLERPYQHGQDVHAQASSCYLTSLSPAEATARGIPAYLTRTDGRMPDRVEVACRSLSAEGGMKDVDAYTRDLRAAHGFDNQGNQLTLSPLLLDTLLARVVVARCSRERHAGAPPPGAASLRPSTPGPSRDPVAALGIGPRHRAGAARPTPPSACPVPVQTRARRRASPRT